VLDHETRGFYNISIQVEDDGAGRLKGACFAEIEVTDVNEAPVLENNLGTVEFFENDADGTDGGRVEGEDVDDGDVITYTISAGDATGAFAIDSTAGNVSVADNSQLNFEVTTSYRLTITAEDEGGLKDTGRLTILIKNGNDAPFGKDVSAAADENLVNAQVAVAGAFDEDVGQGHAFALTRTDHFCWAHTTSSSDVNTFVSVRGAVLPAAADEAEVTVMFRLASRGSSMLALRVGGSGSDAAARYEFEVGCGTSRNQACIRRCGADGTCTDVATSAIARAGTGLTDVVTGESGSTGALASLCATVHRTTGALSIGLRADNEPGTACSTTIVSGTDGATAKLDVKEVMMKSAFTDTRFTSVCFVPAVTGSAVGSRVALVGSTGSISMAVAGDYETQQFLGFEVRATDNNVGSLDPKELSDFGVIMLSFRDKNEQPGWPNTVSCSNGASGMVACFTLKENSAADTLLGTLVTAVDPDALASQTLEYNLGTTNNLAGSAELFVIGKSDRQLRLKTTGHVSFEETRSYQLAVTVSDDGSPSMSQTGQIVVIIEDVNEAPVLERNQVMTVDENSNRGSPVGSGAAFRATDPDSAVHPNDWGTISYQLVGLAGHPNATTIFSINNETGVVTVDADNMLDFEFKNSFDATLRVTDGGGLTDEAKVTFRVLDVNEPPVIWPQTREVREDAVFPNAVGDEIPAWDPDFG